MEIIRKEIPHAFLKKLPEGMKFISKNGSDFLVIEQLTCRHGHSLIFDDVHIHGEPTIKLKVKLKNSEGILFLDSFWGSHAKLYNFMPADYNIIKSADICCPVCNESLLIESNCEAEGCSSKRMIEMILPGNSNRILACASIGCPGHKIEINNLPFDVNEEIGEINFFGIGLEDEIFRGV